MIDVGKKWKIYKEQMSKINMEGNGVSIKKIQNIQISTFMRATKERNRLELDRVAKKLKELLKNENLSETAITITGSDGRLEKGFVSEAEIVIFARNELDPAIAGKIRSHGLDVEVKRIELDKLSFYEGNRSTVFPQRVYDSLVILGDSEIFLEAKRTLVAEWKTVRGVKEEIKRKKAEYKGTVRGEQQWKGRKLKNFDLDAGEAHYHTDEFGSKIRSFKNGPLRWVQFVIANSLISTVRSRGLEEGIEIVQNMPTPTDEKIEFLRAARVLDLDAGEAKELAEIYDYFLCLYHKSEAEAKKGNSITKFEPKEVRERITDLEKIIEGMGVIQ